MHKNTIEIVGTITQPFVLDHEILKDKFFSSVIEVPRFSGTCDYIPVMIPQKLIDPNEARVGMKISIFGQIRSHNLQDGERRKVLKYVFILDYELYQPEETVSDTNDVLLVGNICKQPIYRTTPKGKEITEIVIAVNRPYGRIDYLHCICFGRNARLADLMEVGDLIEVRGRFQSREYKKILEDGAEKAGIAYEIALSKIDVCEEENT